MTRLLLPQAVDEGLALGDFSPQAVPLDQVQGAGISGGKTTCLGENQGQKRVQITSAGECNAYVEQIFQRIR